MDAEMAHPALETATFTYLLLEVNPFVSRGDEAVLRPEYADLPESWLVVLDELLAHVDASWCWRCKTAVGFAVHRDDAIRWCSTALVREENGLIATLCESCIPSVPTHPPWHINAVIPAPSHRRTDPTVAPLPA